MCSTPKYPTVDTKVETVATPTYADASVTKASTAVRNKAASFASHNIGTTARGLLEDPLVQKKGLLGE